MELDVRKYRRSAIMLIINAKLRNKSELAVSVGKVCQASASRELYVVVIITIIILCFKAGFQ
jgi:hypothetical protein